MSNHQHVHHFENPRWSDLWRCFVSTCKCGKEWPDTLGVFLPTAKTLASMDPEQKEAMLDHLREKGLL